MDAMQQEFLNLEFIHSWDNCFTDGLLQKDSIQLIYKIPIYLMFRKSC
uniref:Uncharacterized protein n=1 Tax=Arundo donax TaxID=35708 RepID=A0A0A9ESL5_ARUDO